MKGFKEILAERIVSASDIPLQDVIQGLEYPPNLSLGDLALPCFRFAKTLRKSPQQIADDFAAKLSAYDDVEAVSTNGYLNIKFTRSPFASTIINAIQTDLPGFFSNRRGIGRTAAIDYSAPNIAKPFGVGHLRSTIIGESILRMLREDGYHAFGINHLGDWGTQFGKNIVAYLKWGDEETVRANPIKELFALYVRFHKEAEEHPEYEDEARAWFKRLEDGDEQAVTLWKWFITESLKGFQKTYDLLGVHFDHNLGESFYNDKMEAVVDELTEKHLLVESEGAQVVDLSSYNMPPCIIRKSDGATIYATRDLASANYRHNVLGATDLIYVVGAEQTLHFQQVFKVLELMDHDWAKACRHVAFGFMKYNGERLSTRRGRVIYLEDVLQRAIEEARQIIEQKNPDLENKEAIARQVGIGAVMFNDLKTFRMHDVDFRYEDVLNFDGETGPYVQYTHARACSVLRRAATQGIALEANVSFTAVTDAEWAFIHQLAQANEVFDRAVDDMDPSVIARFALQVCHAFNRFYHDDPILTAEPAIRAHRLALTAACRDVLRHALKLICLEAPEAM